MFFLFFILSCKPQQDNRVSTGFEMTVAKHEVIDRVNSKDLYSSIRYIPLQTVDSALVGTVDQLVVTSSAIFMLSNNRVLVFNMDGLHAYAIDNVGRAPHEYLKINTISVDHDILYLYDNLQYKILCHNVNTGEFISDIAIPFSVKALYVSGGNFYGDRGGIPIEGIDNKEKVLVGSLSNTDNYRTFFGKEYLKDGLSRNDYYLTSHGDSYYIDPIFNEVYRLTPDNVVPYMHFDFSERNVDSTFRNPLSLTELSNRGKVFNLSTFQENDRYVVANVMYGRDNALMIYDKSKRHNRVFLNITNDPYYTNPVTQARYENTFFKLLSPWEVSFMKNNNENKEADTRATELKQVIENRTNDDNPVLVAFELK